MLVAKYAKFLPKTSKQCLIQVGAHEGHEAPILDSAGYHNIIWIEADPDVFSRLQFNLEKYDPSQHQAYNALITQQSGKTYHFYRYSNQGASSSIYQPTDLFSQSFEGISVTENSVELLSTSLDDFIQSHSLSPTTLIIDVQGAELEVLKGGQETLSGVDVVEVEISQQAIYEGGSLFSQVNELLKNAGFTRVTHVPWHGDILYLKIEKLTLYNLLAVKILSFYHQILENTDLLRRFTVLILTRPSTALSKLKSRLFR